MAVIPARPKPVSVLATNNPIGSHANALRSENMLNQSVAVMRAVFLPIWSANQPLETAPRNMPRNVPDVTKPTFPIDSPHCARIAGAAKEKVLMSPNSKKKQKLRSAKICQWNAAMGRQSSRVAAEAR
jgi:hypothetical protein